MLSAVLAWGCAAPPRLEDPFVTPSESQAWVAGVCGPESYDATGWPRYRLGDLLISVPPRYRLSEAVPYSLHFRGSPGGGTLTLKLHRDARYDFDEVNHPRPGQAWCGTRFGGYGAEAIAWHEGFVYGTSARIQATWGGQDEGKWLYALVQASRLSDARVLRHALRTIIAVQDTVRVP